METTYVLDRVLAQKRAQREAMRLAVMEQVCQALEKLSESIPFRRAYIFGTVIKPCRFCEASDVDIAFEGLRDEHFFKAMAYLSKALEREVDVVQIEQHRLRDRILREGILWTKHA